jgi:hypothetical protein
MFYPSTYSGYSSFAATAAASAESAAREVQTNVEIFKHDIDRLLLVTEALWTLMKQQQGYTDDVLVGLIQNIEKQKAAANANAAKDPPAPCPFCGRLNTATRTFCMYCGKPLPAKPFAR